MSRQNNPHQSSPGTPFPLGATFRSAGINFAVFSRHAQHTTLIFSIVAEGRAPESPQEIRLDPELNRTGDIWHIFIACNTDKIFYGYRFEGPNKREAGLVFSAEHALIDPYATMLLPRAWGADSAYGKIPLCIAAKRKPFDWQDDRPIKTPIADTIIYEVHIRGFTRHNSSKVRAPGTYAGLIEKIPYLKELGITAVELLPVTEWDETDNRFFNPQTGELLFNYWGYNPISFFALKSGFAADPLNCLDEFKHMVRSLHQAGIEVILDMVFNHTGEIGYDGKTTGFRGIDNPIYYLLNKTDGTYRNFSGCGNTINCNHPVVRTLIIDSLRYWVTEMHVDGFRFDLASILSRGTTGQAIKNPPLVDMIAEDPLLRDTKIIAEAWDASGLYQVGTFSTDRRWLEWNGRFRDDVRMFLQGRKDTVKTLATRIAGSSDLYQSSKRSPQNSINFLTCHDGFTLYDLVSYHEKANHANGEDNRDGENHNLSWNSGYEGIPCPPEIERIRHRRIRTFAALLMLSQGVPMFTAGDEFGRSQFGNNNSWCQDNDIGWLDWTLEKKNQTLLRFFQKCISLRKTYRIFRRETFFKAPRHNDRKPEITWQSLVPGKQDWSAQCHSLAFLLHGYNSEPLKDDSNFFVMVNGHRSENAPFTIPDIPAGPADRSWRRIIDTAAPSPDDIMEYREGETIAPQSQVIVSAMGLIVLQSGPEIHPDGS